MARPEDTAATHDHLWYRGSEYIFSINVMYRYALKNSHLLQLNKIEEFDTRTSMTTNFLMATVPMPYQSFLLGLSEIALGQA